MTDREDEAKPYDQRMLDLLEAADEILAATNDLGVDWEPAAVRWRERYAKLLADRAQP